MSRKRVDPVLKAFNAWAELTQETQKELARMIQGFKMFCGDKEPEANPAPRTSTARKPRVKKSAQPTAEA